MAALLHGPHPSRHRGRRVEARCRPHLAAIFCSLEKPLQVRGSPDPTPNFKNLFPHYFIFLRFWILS